jgi:hypothetical protein
MNDLHEANQLTFIGCQLAMSRGDAHAEEGQRTGALIKHCTKPCTRSVALHHEFSVKVRELKNRSGRQRLLEGVEGRLRVGIPVEPYPV